MSSQYIVKRKKSGYCDVMYAQLFRSSELEARFNEMMANGWEESEARAEVTLVPKSFVQCNLDPEGYTPEFSWHFIASYIQPGDLIVDGQAFIVNQPGKA